MFIPTSLFFLLLTTIVQCQNILVQFPSFQADIDVGPCTCDLTVGQCDVSCCCDLDCFPSDECNSKDNIYTNSTPIVSSVQPSCVKNLSIFYSNSPYIIQKMGELVCVDFVRYQGSQYYQQPTIQTVDPSAFVQAINAEYSVSAPYSVPTNQTNYQVGTPILTNATSSTGALFSFPVSLFNSPLCSGTQSITYMNNFTSTCSQVVSNSTCTTGGALDPSAYNGAIPLIKSPGNLNSVVILTNASTVTPASFSGGICTGAFQSIIVTIFYQNPDGILNASFTYVPVTTSSSLLQQTFTVNFVDAAIVSSNGTSNPGYLEGASISIGTVNGSAVNVMDSSQFSILQPFQDGSCNSTSASTNRIPIVFGQSIRSTCKYTTTSSSVLPGILTPFGVTNISVGAYGNSDPTNATLDWLPIIVCKAQIGDSNAPNCRDVNINIDSNTLCYVRLDIQIAYTNIGSIFNPQHVLSAVIYYYQYLTTCPTTLLLTGSVTFQDISSAPVVIQGQIPTPNTRVPADFFYPFSVSQGEKSMTFLPFFYLLIAVCFILM